MNNDGDPMVYSIAGVPNDVEENMFWRLCRQLDVDHNRHVSTITPHYQCKYEFCILKLLAHDTN